VGKQVIFFPEVEDCLDELLVALSGKEYFGSAASAKAYVDRLILYIERCIGGFDRKAPPYFGRYGEDLRYIVYRVSRTTSWYIFYQEESDKFLVRHIANNHTVAQFF
jgi:hypothetical protein